MSIIRQYVTQYVGAACGSVKEFTLIYKISYTFKAVKMDKSVR